jgi:hypothetical protein
MHMNVDKARRQVQSAAVVDRQRRFFGATFFHRVDLAVHHHDVSRVRRVLLRIHDGDVIDDVRTM